MSSSMVPRKLKFKITAKGVIPVDSEDRSPDKVLKVILNKDGQRKDRVTDSSGQKRLVAKTLSANSRKKRRRPDTFLDDQETFLDHQETLGDHQEMFLDDHKLHEKVLKVIVNNDNGQRDRVTDSGGKTRPVANVLVTPSNSRKGRQETSLDDQRGQKKRKMDRSLKLECSNILRELMKHPTGWVFNKPVDLRIPDYFKIIAQPMDLGTIKHKLERNVYFGAEEFAADVRLTFSNAMLYNGPGQDVHKWAKNLDANFSRRWKLLEARFKNVEDQCFSDDMKNNGQQIVGNNNHQDAKPLCQRDRVTDSGQKRPVANVFVTTPSANSRKRRPETFLDDERGKKKQKTVGNNNHQDTKPLGLNKGPSRVVKLGTCSPMSSEEKRELRSELMQVLSRKMIDNSGTVFQKFGLITASLNQERLDSYISSTDEGTLWKLRREIKVLLDASNGKVKPSTIALHRCPSSRKPVHKEHSSQTATGSASHGVSTSDLSSERSSEKEHCGDSKLDCGVKYPLAVDARSFAFDSDGPGVVLNEENGPHHLSTPATTADSVEGWTSLNVQLSPRKALRAAMLKSRFADTIFRATHQVPLDNGDKSMQQERERLEREQLKEKERIEAEIKAAKEASRRQQDCLKMQREREREAARMALQKMEKTVEIDENNIHILKELETLCCSVSELPDGEWSCEGVEVIHHGNLMERLGLYIKDDYCDEDEEDAMLMLEEGEILS